MNGYEKRMDKKRRDIIEAARRLFSQRGIEAVSITDIAAEAGVSRVTLFKYFGDKESLAGEVVSEWFLKLMDEYEKITLSDIPLPQKLIKLLEIKLAGREEIGGQLIQEAAWSDKKLQALFNKTAAQYALPKIMQMIKEGKESGVIDEALDDEAIIVYFSTLGSIVKNPEYIKKGERFQASLYNLFIGGLIKNWASKFEKV